MTSEDDFQAKLDANPTDWMTRLVLADWLEEHARLVCWHCKGAGKVPVQWGKRFNEYIDMTCGSCSGLGTGESSDGRRERAEGYRAIGLQGRFPIFTLWCKNPLNEGWSWVKGEFEPGPYHWRGCANRLPPDWSEALQLNHVKKTRREADDAAAAAFSEIPVARQAELLKR